MLDSSEFNPKREPCYVAFAPLSVLALRRIPVASPLVSRAKQKPSLSGVSVSYGDKQGKRKELGEHTYTFTEESLFEGRGKKKLKLDTKKKKTRDILREFVLDETKPALRPRKILLGHWSKNSHQVREEQGGRGSGDAHRPKARYDD